MMHKKILIAALVGLSLQSMPGQQASNMALWTNWDDNTLITYSGIQYNDVWGYSDQLGGEYVILGTAQKILFFNISNPATPTLIASFNGGASSIWRDFKTYGHYAYGVADQGTEGLIVFDLQNLPNSVTKVNQITTDFQRAHNIYIDGSSGRLYVAGSNTLSEGLIVLDVGANPSSPAKIGDTRLDLIGGPSNAYVHDVYVRDDIAYCSHGYSGFYVYDFSNSDNPIALDYTIGSGYNHSSWLTADGQYAIFAEEVPFGLPLRVINLNSMQVVASIKDPLLAPQYLNSTPHNPFVVGNLLYVSYYEDGVQVYNIANPLAPYRIGYYDTNPNNTSYNGTKNNWGVYPFFASGVIAASDTEYGLFLLQLQNPLVPVQWLSFEPNTVQAGIELHWATGSESNNDYFEIQRSNDGYNFLPIAQVKGAGNSAIRQHYHWLDTSPEQGLNYYRLKQVDFDGQYDFSSLEVAHWAPCRSAWSKNVFQKGDGINWPAEESMEEIAIYSLQGQQIYQSNSPLESFTIPAHWIPGVYLLQWTSKCGQGVEKIILE
ncbi:MAG TPA: choice-of-anchor B family protein [Saprospiraceae bacterium]|nr:choice-of-anchor B family protein [Saprospiraceae bacterium]HMQ85241.1 choice-of-anchor B family protein [Saprospiraceae bacterium]